MAIEPVDEFFDDDLAVSALYAHPTSGSKFISVVFDSPYATSVAQGVEYQSSMPAAWAKTIDVPDADDSCTLTVEDVTYNIREVQPDGTGVTKLILTKD